MGSYSHSCAASRLPISDNNKVRGVLLCQDPHGYNQGWGIYSLPLRGVYDGYGRLDEVDETLLETRLSFDILHRDLIYHPWGDNLCHDMPVLPTSTVEDILSAVGGYKENLVRIRNRMEMFPKVKVPKGVPTWKRVEKRLAPHGFEKVVVDRIGYGMVRVRENTYDVTNTFDKVTEVLSKHYTVTFKGKWLLVTPKGQTIPPPNPHDEIKQRRRETAINFYDGHAPPPSRSVLTIEMVLIREDVWQGLLAVAGSDAVEKEFKEGMKAFDFALDIVEHGGQDKFTRESLRKILGEEKYQATLVDNPDKGALANSRHVQYKLKEQWQLGHRIMATTPNSNFLANHFAYLAGLVHRGTVTREAAAKVVLLMAELFVVGDIMYETNAPWVPSPHNGLQYGGQEMAVSVNTLYAKIAQQYLDDNR